MITAFSVVEVCVRERERAEGGRDNGSWGLLLAGWQAQDLGESSFKSPSRRDCSFGREGPCPSGVGGLVARSRHMIHLSGT